jgi:hypothetical protein
MTEAPRSEPEQTPVTNGAVSVRASKHGLRLHVPVVVITGVVAALVGVGANKITDTDPAHAAPPKTAAPSPGYERALVDMNERLDHLNERLDGIEGEQRGLRTDVGEIRGDVRGLRSELRGRRRADP